MEKEATGSRDSSGAVNAHTARGLSHAVAPGGGAPFWLVAQDPEAHGFTGREEPL